MDDNHFKKGQIEKRNVSSIRDNKHYSIWKPWHLVVYDQIKVKHSIRLSNLKKNTPSISAHILLISVYNNNNNNNNLPLAFVNILPPTKILTSLST